MSTLERPIVLIALAAATSACVIGGTHRAQTGDGTNNGSGSDGSNGPVLQVDGSGRELCKLLSNKFAGDPTPNDVQHRANLLSADLGIPVVFDNQLYVLFGDSIGFAGIWGAGESHPDAVGYAADPASMISSTPQLLCTDLQITTVPPGTPSIGPTIDPSVVADFAGAAMAPPPGGSDATFIHNPAGNPATNPPQTFANLPGDYEVPSGAFAYGDSIYVFYTTVTTATSPPTMVASYLARWVTPSPGAPPDYQIMYAVDELVDTKGPLNGHFINIAAEVSGDYVYVFGTGKYRASPIYIARKPLAALATPGGFEQLGTVTLIPGYGETSVRYFPQTQQWMLLAEESLIKPKSNHIVAYSATSPTGPWAGPVVVHDMADPAFRNTYCCTVDDQCAGVQMFDCDMTGFYGSYLLPDAVTANNQFTVAYTLSSFAPYNVALFQSTFSN
jgi:hypothetical protein